MSGQAALDPRDMVLVHIRMPGMDGYEVARRMAAQAAKKPPVLIAATGCATRDDCERAAAAGFDLHRPKPVDPSVLVGLLRRVRRALVPPEPPSPPDQSFPRSVGPDPGGFAPTPACSQPW